MTKSRAKRVVFVPPVKSASEADALLYLAAKPRIGSYLRLAAVTRVREWITQREQEIVDIEHGAAWLLIQRAQHVGDALRRHKGRKRIDVGGDARNGSKPQRAATGIHVHLLGD